MSQAVVVRIGPVCHYRLKATVPEAISIFDPFWNWRVRGWEPDMCFGPFASWRPSVGNVGWSRVGQEGGQCPERSL